MEFDAFTAGIEPGGLRTKNDIRIMVCYILNSVKAPLSKENILNILQEKGLANYFEITVDELIGNDEISAKDDIELNYFDVVWKLDRDAALQLALKYNKK